MSAYLGSFYTALEAFVGAGWPEVLPTATPAGGGVYRSEVITRMALRDQFTELRIPYAVVRVPMMNDAEWGSDQDTYEADVECYLIRRGAEDLSGLITALETFRDYVNDNELTGAGQILPGRRISWDAEMGMNLRLISKQIDAIAGMVAFRVQLGEGA